VLFFVMVERQRPVADRQTQPRVEILTRAAGLLGKTLTFAGSGDKGRAEVVMSIA